MKQSCRLIVLLTLTMAPLATLTAQRKMEANTPTVLFVCEHGTAKSLLAKVLFEEYAAKVGLKMQAMSRGTHADSTVPAWMMQGLNHDNIALGDWRPENLRPTDLSRASLVVSFDVPPSSTSAARAPSVQWDGLPAVSADYATGRDAIKARVRALVDSLKRAESQGKPPAS